MSMSPLEIARLIETQYGTDAGRALAKEDGAEELLNAASAMLSRFEMVLTVEKSDRAWTVRQGVRYADQLNYDEAIGLLSRIMLEKAGKTPAWLMTAEGHAKQKADWNKPKCPPLVWRLEGLRLVARNTAGIVLRDGGEPALFIVARNDAGHRLSQVAPTNLPLLPDGFDEAFDSASSAMARAELFNIERWEEANGCPF